MLLNAFTLFSAGTAVASEKSTSSSAVHPLKALENALLAEDSFFRRTVVNEVQFWKAEPNASFPTLVTFDKSTEVKEVQPENALYNSLPNNEEILVRLGNETLVNEVQFWKA